MFSYEKKRNISSKGKRRWYRLFPKLVFPVYFLSKISNNTNKKLFLELIISPFSMTMFSIYPIIPEDIPVS